MTMLELRDSQEPLLTHGLVSMGPLPTVCDPDGVYPYESFAETGDRPSLRPYRFLAMENDALRVRICPDLGGRVHSLWDKRTGQEVLFVPPTIHPVRILPRYGFVPGGLEVSFPISHTPVQLEPVHGRAARVADRLYVWCGERELHRGMQWTVEYSLGERDDFLTQRTCFRNPGTRPGIWMSWSNAGLPARPDTEFHFPSGPVLQHGAELRTLDWAREGPRRVGEVERMVGFFWRQPDVPAFGVFTPSLGQGLYHLADPADVPGVKLWTYGVGPHEVWGQIGSWHGETYVEIQGGPLRDQSVLGNLAPGAHHAHVEFWLPAAQPRQLRDLRLPEAALVPLRDVPAFDWPPRESARFWLAVLAAGRQQDPRRLPDPPGIDCNWWAPSGMDALGEALGWALRITAGATRAAWQFQLGAWQAARGEIDLALVTLADACDDRGRALAGRLHLRAKRDPHAAAALLRTLRSDAVNLHPQVLIERDLALAALGPATATERAQWFGRVSNAHDEWLLERRAAWLADQGRWSEALNLLEQTPFQRVHQRYVRTRLWQTIQQRVGRPAAEPPACLGEDDLARFGAYRAFDPPE